VRYREVCAHCGAYRDTDTWAQDPETGEQGLTSITYLPADEQSEEWAEVNRARRAILACDDPTAAAAEKFNDLDAEVDDVGDVWLDGRGAWATGAQLVEFAEWLEEV